MTAATSHAPEHLPVKPAKDQGTRTVVALAVVLAIGSVSYFMHRDSLLSYPDAVSHLQIARRVVDSPTSGFSQLGGVWLPLPHLVTTLLVWIEPLYFNGLAGSLVSMAAYVLTAVLLYRIVRELTGQRRAGLVSALVFMLNPNVLYLQATPMTECLLFACLAAMVHAVQRWIHSGSYKALLAGAMASVAATLTRYEGWVLLATLTLGVAVVAWRRRASYEQFEGTTLAFIFVAWTGIVLWLGWNLLLFRDILYFHTGDYAKPSLWVSADEPSYGDWTTAFETYYYAVNANVGKVMGGVALVGLAAFLIRERVSLRALPVLSLLIWFPFFAVALEQGQRPLHVMEISGELYNVRFGLIMVLPAAIFVGYLTTVIHRPHAREFVTLAVLTLAALSAGWAFSSPDRIVTYQEPIEAATGSHIRAASDEVSAHLRAHYTGGRILMEFYGNEWILFTAGITPGSNVYEGSYRIWPSALADPEGSKVQWIVMRHGDSADKVYRELQGSREVTGYRLAFENDYYLVYEGIA